MPTEFDSRIQIPAIDSSSMDKIATAIFIGALNIKGGIYATVAVVK